MHFLSTSENESLNSAWVQHLYLNLAHIQVLRPSLVEPD